MPIFPEISVCILYTILHVLYSTLNLSTINKYMKKIVTNIEVDTKTSIVGQVSHELKT